MWASIDCEACTSSVANINFIMILEKFDKILERCDIVHIYWPSVANGEQIHRGCQTVETEAECHGERWVQICQWRGQLKGTTDTEGDPAGVVAMGNQTVKFRCMIYTIQKCTMNNFPKY